MYHDGEIVQLSEDWEDFCDSSRFAKTREAYQALKVRTFPILLEKWFKQEKTVGKNVVPLICAMNNLFANEDPYGEEGYGDGNDPYAVMVFFPWDFMYGLLNDGLLLNEDGTISIHTHSGQWVVDPKTFDLPDEIPDEEE